MIPEDLKTPKSLDWTRKAEFYSVQESQSDEFMCACCKKVKKTIFTDCMTKFYPLSAAFLHSKNCMISKDDHLCPDCITEATIWLETRINTDQKTLLYAFIDRQYVAPIPSMVESVTLSSPTIYRDDKVINFSEWKELMKHFMYRKLLDFGSCQIADILRACEHYIPISLWQNPRKLNVFFDEFGEEYSDVLLAFSTQTKKQRGGQKKEFARDYSNATFVYLGPRSATMMGNFFLIFPAI